MAIILPMMVVRDCSFTSILRRLTLLAPMMEALKS
jgi:hypothetical protein